VLEHPVIHHPPPQRREVGQRNHGRITAGKIRRTVDAAQRLVAPAGVGMVIAMPLQIVQEQIGDQMI
jgi:hypothetical protein